MKFLLFEECIYSMHDAITKDWFPLIISDVSTFIHNLGIIIAHDGYFASQVYMTYSQHQLHL